MIVAYYFTHNGDGSPEFGILQSPNDSEEFYDLFEFDGEIRAFESKKEAEDWIENKKLEA